jgi:hypothetical protein
MILRMVGWLRALGRAIVRDQLTREERTLLATVAVALPLGWIVLLGRLPPVQRLLVRLRRARRGVP